MRFVAHSLIGVLVVGVLGGCAAGGSHLQTWGMSASDSVSSELDARLRAVEQSRLAARTSAEDGWCESACGGSSHQGDGESGTFLLASVVADLPALADDGGQSGDVQWRDESRPVLAQPRLAADRSESYSTVRAPLPSFWDTVKRDVKNMPRDLWEDTKRVYTDAPNLIILGLTYGGSLALRESGVDSTIEDDFDHHNVFAEDWRDAFGALGNPGTHFALAGAWYLAGQQMQDQETYEVGRTLFSALTITGLSTMLGKAAAWDNSPNGEWGAFPSGHVSSTFAFASVMHDAYGHWVGIPLYGLGALVAIERIEDGEHYFSDVIMGGVMGLVIGHSVAQGHDFELFGGQILPYADPANGSSGVAWVKSW